jgi:hypothetical protein
MSSVRNPVGPQPPAVYWRRRLLVLLGLVAVIVIIVLIVTRPPAQEGRETPTPDPTGTQTSQPQTGDDGDPCNPAVITLEPITDSTSYAEGAQPQISMRITNTGASACTLDVGTAAQEYIIVSGSDPIWNSRTCQTNAAPLEQVLEPNTPLTSTPFAWDRTRSDPSTCNSSRPEVIAAGATYRLSVKLGDLESADDVPFILE